MARSFQELKRNSGKASLEALSAEVEKLDQNKSQSDDRFWYPTVDKAGNGSAIIRFLPAPPQDDDGLPFIRIWDHGFKGPGGKWYIENSLTTIGKDDPVSEYNTVLWNMSDDDNSPTRKQARDQKRRLHYISNIKVIKDPANPENEGKVFLYKYGKKIFDKLNDAMNPQFEDISAMNPFDMFEGANFKLRIRKFEGYRNYDKSEFAEVSQLADTDEEMEEIWNQEYSLQEFLDPKNFGNYDELKTKLYKVLELDADANPSAKKADLKKAEPKPQRESKPKEQPAAESNDSTEDEVPWNTSENDEDEEAAYFAKLRRLAAED